MKYLFSSIAAIVLLGTITAVSFADTTHVVRRGDTLGKIARTHHVPADRIREANGIEGSHLAVGKKLLIPDGKALSRRKAPAPKAVPSDAAGEGSGPAQLHTVRKGESLRSISRKYEVSERDLVRRNHLRRKARPRPGTQLIVRESIPSTWTVREGDTLSGIAMRFNLDTDGLMELNRLTSEDLQAGTQLTLFEPAAPARPAAVATLPTETEPAEAPRASKAADPEASGVPGIPESPKTAEPLKDRLLRVARGMLSVPYRFGGTTLWGLDCSGFVQKAFAFLNLDLPRSAREQFRKGETVEKANLLPGDLVFFRTYAKYPSHVGIYLGDNRFVHASSREKKVTIDSLETPYYVKRYIGARRLLFEENEVQN